MDGNGHFTKGLKSPAASAGHAKGDLFRRGGRLYAALESDVLFFLREEDMTRIVIIQFLGDWVGLKKRALSRYASK